jgi:NtrC-family two-component system response regulator AlgB
MSRTTLPVPIDYTNPLRRHISIEFTAADKSGDICLSTLNPAMSRVIRAAHQAAIGPQTVLLTGEPGVGKRTLARQIQQWSPLRRYPFITFDCAALSFEASEPVRLDQILPHHTIGGSPEAAVSPATILFHNIAALGASDQRRIVEFIEQAELAGTRHRATGAVRVMASTTGGISASSAGFSKDLFFLISEVQLEIPPLRERPEDIPPLAEHMLSCAARNRGTLPTRLAPDAIAALALHTWPGNLRELRDLMERAAVLAQSAPAVTVRHLPRSFGPARDVRNNGSGSLTSLEEMERLYIAQVLAETRSFQKAAATLGIHPSTLWRKRRRYNLMNSPEK